MSSCLWLGVKCYDKARSFGPDVELYKDTIINKTLDIQIDR